MNEIKTVGRQKMYKIGMSTPSNDEITESLFMSCKEAGITHLEISVSNELSKKLDYEKIKAWADKYCITLWSFHLPFWPFSEIDISKPELAKGSVEYLKTYIDKATNIGIDKFVIHASGEPIDDGERAVRMQSAKESLGALADYANEKGAKIAVENLPRTCLGRNSSEMKELLSANPNLVSCFDTNHLLCQDFSEYLDEIGNTVVTLHVSDYDFINERHWLPYEGKIDWPKMLKKLKEIDYKGVWLYELDLVAPNTITRERKLLCKDFADNAEAVFASRIPNFLGTPRENI